MSGTIAPIGLHQFFDANGDPLSSGRVFVYDSGTSSKRSVFADFALSIPHANPLVLNAAGRPTSPIYCTPANALKIVVAAAGADDPPASPLWTVDSVIPTPLPSGILNSQFADVGNVGTGTDIGHTYPVGAGELGTNGDGLRISSGGTFAANGNAKLLALLFGATTLVTSSETGFNGGSWRITAEIRRRSATTQVAISSLVIRDAAAAVTHFQTATTPTETLSAVVAVKTTMQATADNDIVGNFFTVEKLSA